MSVPVPALTQFVQVLDQRAQQSQLDANLARSRVEQTQRQLERLRSMACTAGVKKLHGSVALYANAAGFRSGLLEMAEQCRDTLGVQQLEHVQAQAQMQAAFRKHGGMQTVLQQVRTDMAVLEQRQEQKRTDELAGQAWLRQSVLQGRRAR